MEESPKPSRKRSRLRLRTMNGMLAETLQQLNDLANDPKQSPAKRANAILTKADILRAMYVSMAEERKVAVKAGIETGKSESPTTATASTSTSQSSLSNETLEEKLKRRGIC